MVASSSAGQLPTPETPLVTMGENSTANIKMVVSGAETQMVYENTIRALGRDQRIAGFRKASNPPASMIIAQLGRDTVSMYAANMLILGLESKVDALGLAMVGSARLITPIEEIASQFSPGKEVVVDVRRVAWLTDARIRLVRLCVQMNVDLVPSVTYKSDYTALAITVEKPVPSADQIEQVKKNLCERYVDHVPLTDPNYAAQLGDRLIVDMEGMDRYMRVGFRVRNAHSVKATKRMPTAAAERSLTRWRVGKTLL
jgi:FKBP-type peptidyl-prolyl cis-trans isomerase (trigger factor)